MRLRLPLTAVVGIAFPLFLLSTARTAGAAVPGTSITYQGLLKDGPSPASGSYDLRFILYNASEGGTQVGPILTKEDVAVSGGLVKTDLDFGGVFGPEELWLEVSVRAGSGMGGFTTLSPRQRMTSVAQSLSVPWAGVTGIPAGFMDRTDNDTTYTAGSGLTLNGLAFGLDFAGSGAANTPARSDHDHAGFWRLGGNAGIDPAANFLGTTDGQPLLFRVENTVALGIYPTKVKLKTEGEPDVIGPPNLVGGYLTNSVTPTVVGATLVGGGGFHHNLNGDTLPNTINGNYGAIVGGLGNKIEYLPLNPTNSPYGFIGGGRDNLVSQYGAATVGGERNKNNSILGFIGGGTSNELIGPLSVIAGGTGNKASGSAAFIGSGSGNEASGGLSAIGAGGSNQATATYTVIGGGSGNEATATHAVIGGGFDHTAGGSYSTIPGGYKNTTSEPYSFAAGFGAEAIHRGAFVWADYPTTNAALRLKSTAENQFLVRAAGGTRILSNMNGTTGVALNPGGGSWGNVSDVNAKTAFSPVDGKALLERLERVKIQTWQYKAQDASIRHIGPTAQEFREAFKVGEDERHITTVDADGVALAAIQELTRQIKDLQKQNAELAARLKKLENRGKKR